MIEHVDILLYLVCLLDWSLATLGRWVASAVLTAKQQA